MHEWNTVVNTLSGYWFGRREGEIERWFKVVGLAFHFWSEKNILKLGERVGEPVVVDQNRIDIVKIDLQGGKWSAERSLPVSKPLIVCDGLKEYKVMMFLAEVSNEDFNLILDFQSNEEAEAAWIKWLS